MGFSISSTQAAAIFAVLTTTVRGHMVLGNPVPFDFQDQSTKQAPLLATGADFPCKFQGGFQPVPHTKNEPMAPGSSDNVLSFIGGATHGGGSCQVSLTKDTVPTKDSKWEVIHSIEGGCPADAEGNLSDNAQDTNSNTFKYTIPADMAPGKYTLAWTWFNKIGNREMYMNCAPIEIAGGSAKRDMQKINKKRQSSRPDMMLANIGNGCSTAPSKDVIFPDPGDSLEKGASLQAADPIGGDACGAAGAQSAGSTSDSTPSGASGAAAGSGTSPAAPSSSSATASTSTSTAPATSIAPNNTGTGATSGDGAGATNGDGAGATNGDGAGAATPSDTAGVSSAAGAPCSPEGKYVCAPDGSSFTRCASGIMSAPQQMSAGMKCTPGQESTDLKMGAIRRSPRFGAPHAARAFAAAV